MPLRKKSNLNMQTPGQPLEKSMSSPDISDEKEHNKRDSAYSDTRAAGNPNVKRKKSWFSRFFSKIRRNKKRTITEPSECREQSSCLPLQKSPSSTFYASTPYGLLMEATKPNDDETEEQTDGNDSELSDDADHIVIPNKILGSPIQPSVIDELKSYLNKDHKFGGNESSKTGPEVPVYGNEADLKHVTTSPRRKQRPRSADSNGLTKRFSDFEQIYERTWEIDVPSPKQKEQSRDGPSCTDNVDVSRSPDLEPQPIEPLHKFPKPRPPVNRRPSTRRPSRCSEDDPLSNPRRSQADLEEILQKLKDIPPPEVNDTSAQNAPIPKKRTKLPSSPKDVISPGTDSEIKSKSVEILSGDEAEISELHSDEAAKKIEPLKPSPDDNNKVVLKAPSKPPLPPKLLKLSRSKTSPWSIKASPDSPVTPTNINKLDSNITSQECDNYDEVLPEPMKRWKTLPTSYQWSQSSQTNVIHSDLQGKYQTLNTLPTVTNSQTQTQIIEVSHPCNVNLETTNENSFRVSGLDPYIEQFQNVMKHYINDLEKKTYNDQSTPPNTPEQLEESNESEDDLNTVVNVYQISNGETSHSLSKMPDNTVNSSLNKQSVMISNEIYASAGIMSSITSKKVEKMSVLEGEGIECIPSTEMSSTEDVQERVVLSKTSEKPITLKRKPPLTPKPLVLPKQDEFVRRGAVRQKRSASTSDDQTPSPGINPNRRDSSNSQADNDKNPLMRVSENLQWNLSSHRTNVPSESEQRTKDLEKKRRSQSLI